MHATLYRFNASTNTWTVVTTGFNGDLMDVHGPSANRVFLLGRDTNYTGHVLFFDGLGFTTEPIPANQPALNGVFGLPTGEVFVVGQFGSILKGP